MRIRPATEKDAGTSFMLLEPGERTTTVEEEREQLRRFAAAGNRVALVAEENGRLAGLLEVPGGRFRRERHTAYLVPGVLWEHSGKGIGRALLESAERRASEHGILRLELTVMWNNQAKIHLYRKSGFETEGTRRRALRVHGSLVDELYMAKLLPTPGT